THCAAGEFCASDTSLCLGAGRCVARHNCGSGTSLGICGCNGINYPNFEAACAAGVRIASYQYGCGSMWPPDGYSAGIVTYCGMDSQCPTGTSCCAITGRCYDPNKPGLCAFPPAGTRLPCLEDTDCVNGWVGEPKGFCWGPGCSGPGGCMIVGGLCDGELAPVCGCNGKNYMNEKCAQVVPVRVRNAGYCADAEANRN